MKKKFVAATAVAVAFGSALVVMPSAHADTVTTIRSGDFLPTLSDTRDNGLVTVGDHGIGVYTAIVGGDSYNAKAAEYWAADVALKDAGEPALNWKGTTTAPGKQLYVDLDGDPSTGMYNNTAYKGADGILVGEMYTGTDGKPSWWLNNSATAAVKALAPQQPNGGNTQWQGTLDEWRAAFPKATVVATGFSMGSGATGSGIITSTTLGDTTYDFAGKDAVVTPTPVTTAPGDVTGTASGTTVSLSWSSVPGATGYSIYRNGVAQPVGESFSTSGQVGGLQPGTSYSFQVAGHMADGTTGPKSAAVTVSTPPVTLSPVKTMYGTSVTTSSAILLWSVPDAHATGYYVFRNGVQVGYTYGTWLSNKDLKSKTSYTFQVQAVGAGGAKAAKSASFVITTK